MKDFLARVPLGWVKTNLGQITFDKVGQGLTTQDNDFIYIDISSINNELKEITAAKSMPVAKAPSRARQQVEGNDVLVSMTRPNLNAVAIVPEDMAGSIASTGFDVLRGILVNPKWIFAHVRSQRFINEMTQRVQGALYPAVKSADVRSYEILLPPLPEQNRLVGKIESLQSRSSNARKALETIPPLLEKFRQSVLSSAFRGDLTADWRAQNPDIEPAEKLLERIRKERRKRWVEDELAKMKAKGQTPKDDKWKKKYKEPEPIDTTDLPELPEGWCWVALEELSEKVTDGTHQSPPFVESGIPFLVIGNIIKGEIDWEGVNKWVTEATYEKYTATCKPEKGDVLYSAVGSYGVAVEVITDRTFMFQRHIAHIKPVKNAVSPTYIMLSLNSPSSLAQAHKVARGVAQKTVTLTYLRRFNLALPPEREQSEIIKCVNKALRLSENIKRLVGDSIAQVELLDQSVLSKAFRGELVPQDPNDEPASELLKRIKQEKASLETGKKTRGKPGRKKTIHKDRVKQMAKKRERRPLGEVLQPHSSGLSPEELFSQAGFDEHSVDEFYVELKNEVVRGNIIEDRPDRERVILRLNAA